MAISTIAGVGAGSSGTILTTGSPQSGGVIQVVSSVFSTSQTTSNNAFVTTGFAVSITPKFSTSKVLVRVNGGMCDTNGTAQQGILTILRGASTNLGDSIRGLAQFYNAAGRQQTPIAMEILDSPATTSSTTYTIYFRANGAYTVGIEIDPAYLSMTLMEIAA